MEVIHGVYPWGHIPEQGIILFKGYLVEGVTKR